MLNVGDLPRLYTAYRQRYSERDDRMELMRNVVTGNFDIFDPDEDKVEFRSANLIQVAIEDTSEAAAILPTIRVQPSRPGPASKKSAARTERICQYHLESSNISLLVPQTIADMITYGLGVWVVYPDIEQKIARYEKRDPRTCYPEPGFRPGDEVRRCIFSRELFWTQLPEDWKAKVATTMSQHGSSFMSGVVENIKLTIVEWFDEDECVIAALYSTSGSSWTTGEEGYVGLVPIELERIPNEVGVCPVVIGSRFSIDGQFRGQFDQVVKMLEAHGRLMGLLLDYADQAVYSDIWVRDLVGEMPYGGGSFIELGPNGAIGRVPPAVSSMNVGADLQMLTESMHLGGRWPKTRPGDIDQSIASAKFVEATAGMMNTNLKTLHQLMQHMIERALTVGLRWDKAKFSGAAKTMSGVLRNQEFLEEYDSADIDLTHKVRAEYGLGLGRDPAQSAVLHLQYSQAGFISRELVMEQIDGLTDVAREQTRIDLEQFRGVMLAKILQGVEQGTVSDRQLLDIAQARSDGKDIWAVFEEAIVKPSEEAAMAGPQVPPGMPPQMAAMLGAGGPPGMPPGGGPPGAAPPGGGPQPPPSPGPTELLNRLSVRTPDGQGMLGSQVASGGR